MAPVGRVGVRGARVAPLLFAGLLLSPPSAAAPQEREPRPPPADTAPVEPGDTLEAAEPPPPAVLPDVLHRPGGGFHQVVAEWDRQELLDETAPSLLGIISRELPGLTGLRAEYFTGSHLFADGLLGAGFVRVRLDGREMASLEAGAVDLSRISLAMLESVRILRRPDGVTVEAETLRRDRSEAYSRIEGATGDPDIDLIRGIFTNGLGRDFDIATAIDFFNLGAGPLPANRFDAWGRVGWVPGDRDAGLEVWWRSESIERVLEGETEFRREEVFAHGRANPFPGVQAELWAGTETREPSGGSSGGISAGEQDAMAGTSVTQVELRITGVGERGYVETEARTRSQAGHPSVAAELAAGVRPLDRLVLDGRAELAFWEDFVSSSVGGGVSFRPELGLGARLRVAGGTGTRGLPRPRSGDPVQVSFRALAARGELSPGPYRFWHRIAYQDLDAQHPFGGRLDEGLEAVRPGEIVAFESGLSGPPLPVSDFLESFRAEGVWRFQRRLSAGRALYAPRHLFRAALSFRRTFFEDNLEIQLRGGMGYREAMLTARPATGVSEVVPAAVTTDASVMMRIDTFRLWWRADNMLRRRLEDYGGLPHPINPYVFGVKWAFTN